MANTSMVHAYLRALTDWAVAHHTNPAATITLPVGRVTVTELLKILRALEVARGSN
jgi:Zn finger protein HypA/HybF involved in hydrogenase expression